MNIIYKGGFLREGLLAAGHSILDFKPGPEQDLHACIDNYGFSPDLILWEMFGGHSDLAGLKQCECPVVIYCVDSPINEFWLKHVARNADYVFVDQPQSVENLALAGLESTWLPLPAPRSYFQPQRPKKHDITFIGTVDHYRQKRKNVLDLIAKKFNINIMSGIPIPEAQKVFSESRIIINENFFPGLTLRVLQGLAAGTVVFTERSPLGSDFGLKDREDLIYYDSSDLLDQLAEVLGNYDNFASIATHGQRACEALYAAETLIRTRFEDAIGKPAARKPVNKLEYEWNKIQAEFLYFQRFGGNLGSLVPRLSAIGKARPEIMAEALLLTGDILAKGGRLDKAGENYLKASEMEPQGRAPFKLALLEIRAGNLPAAARRISGWLTQAPYDADQILAQMPRGEAEAYLGLAEICYRSGERWQMGFSKSFPDPAPDTAMELALLSWQKRPTADALSIMRNCLAPFHLESELLPYMLEAIRQGMLSDAQILETARLAFEYYDHEAASTIMSALRRCRPTGRPG